MGWWAKENANNNTINDIHSRNNNRTNNRREEKEMKYNEKNYAYKLTTQKEIEQMKYNFDRWFNSDELNITDAYGRPSQTKIDIFNNLIDEAYDLYQFVTGISVVSHNCFIFTMGYEFMDNETGEMCFMYITPNKKVYCPITDLE